MIQTNKIKRVKIIFLSLLAFALAMSFAVSNIKTEATSSVTVGNRGEDPGQGKEAKKKTTTNPKSIGCVVCHTGHLDEESMHFDGDEELNIGCSDCHGGDPTETVNKYKAHVLSRNRKPEDTSDLKRINADWNKESDDYVRFINPGDIRAADAACGKCHEREVMWMKKSMMTHGAMLWGAALYNNGAFPMKDSNFGESYGKDGRIQGILTNPPPTLEETLKKGILPALRPIPRWEIMQPGNVLRVFERGGEEKGLPSDIGSPSTFELGGKPEDKLSDRGFGTRLRTDPVFLGLQKTRLLDPLLSFPGSNDNPGDYRMSGCTACHVVYANDRDPKHSAQFAQYGNQGLSVTADPTIPKGESGHPIKHKMVLGAPSSSCMVCHMHPGGNMETSYYGMTWWDNETDGNLMYPAKQPDLSDEQKDLIQQRNPEGAAMRGLWGQDRNFLQKIWTDVNPKAQRTQFGDFHGHGWVYRNVYRSDRKGNMLNSSGQKIKPDDPDKFKKGVHLEDVHQKKGMHCADCHVSTDVHGNGNIYNEPRAAIQVDCIDCHGTIDKPATLMLTGPAAGTGRFGGKIVTTSKDLTKIKTRNERGRQIPLFQRIAQPTKRKTLDGKEVDLRAGDIVQNSLVEPGKWWRVVQTVDTTTPGKRDYNDASAYAKTVQREGKPGGDENADDRKLAPAKRNMPCY